MRKLLLVLFVVLVGAILVEAAYLYSRFSSSSPKIASLQNDRSFALPTPTSTAEAAFQIVSQKEGDL